MTDILLIGAGRIGMPIVRRLVRAGHTVRVYDARPELQAAVLATGATWTDKPGSAEVVFTVLPGSPELRSVMLSPDGLLERLESGTTWVDLTSASPALGEELAEAARRSQVAYVEAPVGGGVPAAEAGQLTLYVGGEPAAIERVQPVLEAFTAKLHRTGPSGTGYLTKLLVNLLWFTQATAVGEALLLGQSAGLDPSYLREVLLDGPAASAFIADTVPSLLAGDYLPTFGLDRIVEELESMESFARHQHTPADLIAQVTAQHRAALAHFGPANGELLAIAQLEQLAGRAIRGLGS
ncbi:NAD(P)-dependent oxidoreductase [Kribbella sp. NPDC055071]